MPVSKAARQILHGGLCAWLDDLHSVGVVIDRRQETSRKASRAECLGGDDRLQVVEIGFDPVEARSPE